MSLTVTQGWADVRSRVQNIGDVDSDQQLSLATIVNREVRDEIIESDPERILTTGSSISITSDHQTETLPADFETFQALSCGVFKVNDDGTLGDRVIEIQEGDSTTGFYLTDTSIVFHNLNTVTVKLKYIPTLTDFTAGTDTFVVGTRFRECVRAGLLAQYYWQKGQAFDQEYINWNSEYVARLEELSQKIKRTPSVYSLKDYSSSY